MLSSKEDMERIYGTSYSQEGDIYTYTQGKGTLSITIEDDTVSEIEYLYIVE